MSKKTLFVLLAVITILGLAACQPQVQEPASDDDWKIGIMTGTVTQNEEEFRMAEQMQQRYGEDRILISTYPDRFMQEQETTITNMLEMASDPNVKAIVMVQAVPGTVAAVDKVREIRSDMLFVLGAPQEDPDIITQKGDIILNADDLGRGAQIAEHAHNMGAEVLVHYSFPRHMSIEFLAQRRELMKARAEELGILFVDEDAPDPTGDAGTPGTQQFIMEDVPRKIEQYGPNTAVFGTNCAMMEPLIRQAVEYGGIFPVQCCPSPYHAMPGAEIKGLDLEVYRGEILGLGGLAGQGKIGVANGIMGLYPARGTVRMNGGPLRLNDTSTSIAHGLAFVSEDRRGVGLLLDSSVEMNIVITAMQNQDRFMHKFGFLTQVNSRAMRQHTLKMIAALDIRCTGPGQEVKRLSGGNQQKVCIARALTLEPKVLFVSEPTRGIDVGAKRLVLETLIRLNQEHGVTIVMTSSELGELRMVCDRIAIITAGKLAGVLRPDDSDVEFGLLMAGQKSRVEQGV